MPQPHSFHVAVPKSDRLGYESICLRRGTRPPGSSFPKFRDNFLWRNAGDLPVRYNNMKEKRNADQIKT